ncbi:DNA-directed RNA polymerase subunit D [uncultured archaeon]|nr:DNA-directed RNA polymerase subunit D [uncultured archaeon]
MIPLKMEKGMNEKTEEQLSLVAKSDGMIYSGEIKGKIKPVYDNIPITVLKKGQEFEIVATARVGKGSKHTKFSPGLMFYRNLIKVKAEKDCPKEVVNICPRNVFKVENGKVIVADEEKCDMCEACTDLCTKMGKKSIELTPTNELVLTVESFGQMDEEEIFKKAIESLKDDLEEVTKKISK